MVSAPSRGEETLQTASRKPLPKECFNVTRTKIGVIGCGNISDVYLPLGATYDNLEIVACADSIPERARAKAEKHHIPRACNADELLADPAIEIVIDLTPPQLHGEMGLRVVRAGKSLYSEKPLAIRGSEARDILQEAKRRGVRVGCAPDTFLGGGLQSCRQLVDEGSIGEPIAATALMLCHGHEHWHPDPEFFYQRGGGPMFDMGPYYLTALATILGPAQRVCGSTKAAFKERVVTSQPKSGTKIQVNVPTHVAGIVDFTGGVLATIVTSFDVWSTEMSRIEIYGTEGTLQLPDPNTFGGPLRIWKPDAPTWREVPLTHGHAFPSRGVGLAEMVYAMKSKRPHRADGELASHVLDIMQAIHESSEHNAHLQLTSTFTRPAAFPEAKPGDMIKEDW